MEITGTIKHILEPQSGTTQSGKPFTKQTVVITYGEQYPKELALVMLTKAFETYSASLTEGQTLRFHFDASSREYSGRWYTECVLWKIDTPAARQPAPAVAAMPAPPVAAHPGHAALMPQSPYPQQPPHQSAEDDLPF